MFVDLERVAIYVKPGKTDFRKQINGLSIIVEEELRLDPFSGALFLFCNGQRRLLKILYWDRTGFILWLLCEASHNNHYAKLRVMRRRPRDFGHGTGKRGLLSISTSHNTVEQSGGPSEIHQPPKEVGVAVPVR